MTRRTVPAQLVPFREYRKQPDFGCSVPDDRDSWLIAPCAQNRDSDFDGGGCNFPISRAVDNLGRDELAAFVRKLRSA